MLQSSSYDWHENKNDYNPFVSYILGIILGAYREFSERVQVVAESKLSKPERVRNAIKDSITPITKTELINYFKDEISDVTIQRALNDLTKKGEILKIGGGRYTAYVWNHNKEN